MSQQEFAARRYAEEWFDEDAPDSDAASSVRVFAAGDVRWYEITRPIFIYICKPRSWGEILKWGDVHDVKLDMLRMMLAALDHRNEACTIGKGRAIRWMAIQYRKRRRGAEHAIIQKDDESESR
jgi:hypothetical protein